MKNIYREKQAGMVTPLLLVILAIFFVLATAIMSWSVSSRKDLKNKVKNTEALTVAEAGVEYYRWHLNHNEADFQNGESWCCKDAAGAELAPDACGYVCGPYRGIYKDAEGNNVGEYALKINSPRSGYTITQIDSTGWLYDDANYKRTVRVNLGKRSLARFSFLSNAPLWIGKGEDTSGPVHSNDGIRFDGTCDAEVTSAVMTYISKSWGLHDGIWSSLHPGDPGFNANRLCQRFWQFPDPAVDFSLFTVDMNKIKQAAQNGGVYLPPSPNGYHVIFNADATVIAKRVDSLVANAGTRFYDERANGGKGDWVLGYEEIQKETLVGTYPVPANGAIFVDGNVWVEGTVNGRATLAASKFQTDYTKQARIIINDNIQYLDKSGDHVLGMMSEGDIIAPLHAPSDNFFIDAVMLSQKGHVYRRDYKTNQKESKTITVYGGIISYLFWTWSYVDSYGRLVGGYRNTITEYDNHLTYGPPPFFPTEANFSLISWEEFKS